MKRFKSPRARAGRENTLAVTVSDIAKRASVSVGTVSRVLNNRPNIGPERKSRVLTAMEELDYTPNMWARGMGKGLKRIQTGQIALLLINIPDYAMHTAFMMQYIHGVQQEIAAAGRKCTFVTWNDQVDGEVPQVLLDGEIDGVIFKVQGSLDNEVGKQWLNRYPRVFLNPVSTSPGCDCVMVDYEEGIRDCVAYLSSLGHRRIAFIDMRAFHTKLLGYRCAVEQLGLDLDEDLIHIREVVSLLQLESDLNRTIENLWSLPKPPTAILSTDSFCGVMYRALAKHGLKVPNDVSLVGYDNDTSYCEALMPKLTSMDIAAVEVGKTAVRQLLDRIKNPRDHNQKIYIQGHLVERESVNDRQQATGTTKLQRQNDKT